MKICLINGTVVSENGVENGDLLLDGEKIAGIGPNLRTEADEVVDCTGKLIFPGGIDPHTHMDLQQSPEHRAVDDFVSGTIAAACGGTTSIIDHVAFGRDGASLTEVIDEYHDLAKNAVIDYGFHAAIQRVDDEVLEEVASLVKEKGVISVKAYTTYGYAQDDVPMYRLLECMKENGGVLTVHCENDAIIADLIRSHKEKGEVAPRYFAETRPPEAEAESVDTLIRWAQLAGDAPLYIVHTSSGESIERIRAAKAAGQKNLFSETCPQYLFFDDSRYQQAPEEAIKYMMQPPLRSKAQQEMLCKALDEGVVDTIGTDHCPFTYAEKEGALNDFAGAPGGIPGVEERVLLLYDYCVEHELPLKRFVHLISSNPAKIFGMYPAKGSFLPGADADLVVLDPNGSTTFSKQKQHSRCDYNTYEGKTVHGKIVAVYSHGQQIVENGVFKGQEGAGRYLHRKPHTENVYDRD